MRPSTRSSPSIRGETENGVERGALAGAVRTDQSEDAALFDPQINAVERDRCPEGFAQSACFYAGHGVSASPSGSSREARAAAASSSFCVRPEPLNGGRHPRPFFGEKFLAFALEQKIARAGFDEHPEPALHLDQLLVDQLLISLENRERIDPKFGRDVAHGGQRIAFFEHAVENHVDAPVAQLAVNRLTVVPFPIHPVFHINHRASYSDIVNYNTSAQASAFFIFLLPAVPATPRACSGKPLGEKTEAPWFKRTPRPSSGTSHSTTRPIRRSSPPFSTGTFQEVAIRIRCLTSSSDGPKCESFCGL